MRKWLRDPTQTVLVLGTGILVSCYLISEMEFGDRPERPNKTERKPQEAERLKKPITRADPMVLESAKNLIGKQVESIVAGNLENLRRTFVPRLHNAITRDALNAGKRQCAAMPNHELAAGVQLDADGERAIVLTRQGRVLTALVKWKGQWLCDSIWFD